MNKRISNNIGCYIKNNSNIYALFNSAIKLRKILCIFQTDINRIAEQRGVIKYKCPNLWALFRIF